MRSSKLAAIMLITFVWNCGWFVLQAAFMPLAVQSWGLSAQTVGYALGCMGLGFMAGSYLSQRIVKWLGFGPSLAFGSVISCVASLLILVNMQLASAILPALGFFLFGFSPVIWVIVSNTLRQLITPGHMIGCVSGIYLTIGWGRGFWAR